GPPELLVRVEAARRLAVGSGPRDRGVEVLDRRDVLDRGVGPVQDARAALPQLAPDVAALGDTRVAEPLQGPGPVGRAVDALHRGEHAEPAEARDVGSVQD